MRSFQTKSNVGGGPDSITATKHGGGEFNAVVDELENAVTRAGLSLAGAADGTGDVLTQLGQSLFLNSVKATTFQAAGTADAITLTPVSGTSGVVIPPDYTAIDGAIINFIPTAPNTGNVTISWGQTGGTQLGTKKALDEAGAELPAGTLTATRIQFVYDASADAATGAWVLVPWTAGNIFASGSVIDFAGATAPTGWQLCYGQAISRTTFADLFTAIGTLYGVGDGATTFNLPDCRGRIIAGQDDMGGVSANRLTGASGGVDGDVLAGTGGDETHTLTVAELAAHTHTVATEDDTTAQGTNLPYGTTSVIESSTTTTSSTGSGDAHNNVQPTIIMNKIIKE